MSATYLIGDLHGHLEKTTAHLHRAGLIDAVGKWSGADATLCFIGDYCDRGPDGLGCLDLVMRLQREARATGGQVIALMGNHEVLILGAYRFGDQPIAGLYEPFRQGWKRNGGVERDLAGLTPAHVTWLRGLPAMTKLGKHLLIHADALFYSNLGSSPQTVNGAITAILQGDDPLAWDSLLGAFSERLAFYGEDKPGASLAQLFLNTFKAEQLIHGHTPIPYMTGRPPAQVTMPLFYADDCCINVDGGMYMGGPGFVYPLDESVGSTIVF